MTKAIAAVGVLSVSVVAVLAFNLVNPINKTSLVAGTQSVTLTPQSPSDLVNEDGSSYSEGKSTIWLGTGQNTADSYLGIRFTGAQIPMNATINSAKVEFSLPKDEWINVSFDVFGDRGSEDTFSSSNKPSQRSLTSAKSSHADNVLWKKDTTYAYDVRMPIQELVNQSDKQSVVLIFKGTGSQWGRKFPHALSNPPKLIVEYSTQSQLPTVSPPSGTPALTKSPTNTPTSIPTSTPTPSPAPLTPTPTPSNDQGETSGIFGAVPDSILGTCFHQVHDSFVVTADDGIKYRTWHPVTVDGCSFAHEHGDDPTTSNIDNSLPPFGYIGQKIGIDEPHAGFKVFVANKGVTNDEGSTYLHDSKLVFHMGTGGPKRFSTRFHSMDFKLVRRDGAKMFVQGMADVGQVGTICNSPRQQRTVMGFGCVLDSAYEIWLNKLTIRNQGRTIARVDTSTAVFDPITVMDPNNLDRLIYVWSPEARQIFRFNNNREGYRGCVREAYHGPAVWYNRGGAEVYYTDAYGNVTNNGPLIQVISAINSDFGSSTGGLGYVATYKGGNQAEPQSQFKLPGQYCAPSLGTAN